MISFVVPAHNEERLLGRTLDALHAAGHEMGLPYEVIVVDDGSADATGSIAAARGARVVAIRGRHIALARNVGARVARGDVFIFVDADTVAPVATVRASLHALQAGAVGGGAAVRLEGRLPAYARWLAPIVLGAMRVTRLAAGCYMFCSRKAFEAAGGFDERLYAAEEIQFSRALGRLGRVVIVGEPVITSGRKLRTHSGWEILRLMGQLVRRGAGAVRTRDHLTLWYGERRHELDAASDITGERGQA